MVSRHLNTDSPWLLGLLAAIVALGPLSVDMYLPAMPSMMRELDTDIGYMHLTLSVYLTGFAMFHLVCGPLADRFGRKPVLTFGTGLFVLACLGCAQSSSITELLVFRFLQGLGACVGPSLARTVARDMFGPRRAARALSLIAMLMALAPAVAPLIGGFLLLLLPWPVIFIFLATYAALMIFLLQVYLPESLPEAQSLHPLSILRNYGLLITNANYLSVTLTGALVYSALMAYLSSSSFVFIDMLGVPVQYFGFIFISTVFGYIVGSAVSARLASVLDSRRTILWGALLCVAATSSMWLGHTIYPESVLALVLPTTLYTVGMGMVLPHTMTIALAPFPYIAGTASSLLGFIQMGIASITAALVGQLLHDSPQPMTATMFIITLVSLALSIRLQRSIIST